MRIFKSESALSNTADTVHGCDNANASTKKRLPEQTQLLSTSNKVAIMWWYGGWRSLRTSGSIYAHCDFLIKSSDPKSDFFPLQSVRPFGKKGRRSKY